MVSNGSSRGELGRERGYSKHRQRTTAIYLIGWNYPSHTTDQIDTGQTRLEDEEKAKWRLFARVKSGYGVERINGIEHPGDCWWFFLLTDYLED